MVGPFRPSPLFVPWALRTRPRGHLGQIVAFVTLFTMLAQNRCQTLKEIRAANKTVRIIETILYGSADFSPSCLLDTANSNNRPDNDDHTEIMHRRRCFQLLADSKHRNPAIVATTFWSPARRSSRRTHPNMAVCGRLSPISAVSGVFYRLLKLPGAGVTRGCRAKNRTPRVRWLARH